MENITEVRNGFTNDQNFTHIDVWESEDEDAEGRTGAIICQDTKKVYYIDNTLRLNAQVTASIKEIVDLLN